jgi:hypothetical protein
MILLIILLVLLLGGGGVFGWNRYGAPVGGSLLGTLLVILIVLWLLGRL